jgi:hypothetical protein
MQVILTANYFMRHISDLITKKNCKLSDYVFL